MLEPYAVKVACTVLRGERSREAPDLPGCGLSNIGKAIKLRKIDGNR